MKLLNEKQLTDAFEDFWELEGHKLHRKPAESDEDYRKRCVKAGFIQGIIFELDLTINKLSEAQLIGSNEEGSE